MDVTKCEKCGNYTPYSKRDNEQLSWDCEKKPIDGLHDKYTVIDNRTGEKVKGSCFILKPENDETARKAIIAYADATNNKELADDLRKWINNIGTCN